MLSSGVWCSRVSDSMAARILLGNPDGVEPDSMAAHVLLGNPDGVELDGSLHLTHANGPLVTSGYLIRNYVPSDMSGSVDRIFHIRIPWRRMGEATFQIPRTDMSGSSDSAHPESIRGWHFRLPGSLQAEGRTLHNAVVFSWSFQIFSTNILRYFRPTSWDIFDRHLEIFSTDILRYFALDIWCLNPQTLLVIYLS